MLVENDLKADAIRLLSYFTIVLTLQMCLNRLTGLDYSRVFRVARRGQEIKAPTYVFMTDEVIEVGLKQNKLKSKQTPNWFQDCCKSWSLNRVFCFMVLTKYIEVKFVQQISGSPVTVDHFGNYIQGYLHDIHIEDCICDQFPHDFSTNLIQNPNLKGVSFKKKIANSCIWGPILWAILTKNGSSN